MREEEEGVEVVDLEGPEEPEEHVVGDEEEGKIY